MKFIPEISPEQFWGIINSNPRASQRDSPLYYCLTANTMKDQIEVEVFAYEAPYTQLNFPSEGGITAYFSRNMTQKDLALTKEFLLSAEAVTKGLDILNTRVFKKSSIEFLLTVGSISSEGSCTMYFREYTFTVQYGEFSAYLKQMNSYLEKALPYAANEL